MTLPLPANWQTGQEFTADAENAVELAVDALGNGSLPIPRRVLPSAASTLTITTSYNVYVYTGTSDATWTLPAVSGVGTILHLYHRGSGVVTVNAAGSDSMYVGGKSAATTPLSPGSSLKLVSDGTYWLVFGSGVAVLPSFDNSALGANHQASGNLASGAAYTWTQVVGAGLPYGLVAVWYQGNLDPTTVTFAVTFGGVTLELLTYAFNTHVGWVAVFGGPGIPSGTQTVSVTMTATGQTFPVVGASFTYTSVAAAGAAVSEFASFSNSVGNDGVTVARDSSAPGRTWFAEIAINNTIMIVDVITRQQFDSGYTTAGIAGDRGICGPEDQRHNIWMDNTSGGFISEGLVALALLGQLPSNPYLDAVGPGLSGGGSSHTFTSHARTGAYVLVAVNYRKQSGGSLSGVTYGATAMTQLGHAYLNGDTSGASGELYVFGLANVAGGFQTVSVNSTGATPSNLIANTASYFGVHTAGAAVSKTGSASTLSQGPISCSPGQLIFQCFAEEQNIVTATGSASNLCIVPPAAGQVGSLSINQSVAASTTFTGGNGSAWAGIEIPLS